jgi:hypothetical protein
MLPNQNICGTISESETGSLTIDYKAFATPDKITVKAYEYVKYTDNEGWERYKKSDKRRKVTVPYYADYYATKSTKFPFAYILPIPDKKVIETTIVN